MESKNKGFHYAWRICFVGFVIYFFIITITSNCVGLFVKPVCEELGITRSAFSLTTSCYSIAGMIVAAIIGKVFKKIGIRKTMRIRSVRLPLFYGCYSFAPSIYMFYVIAFFVGFCVQCMAGVPISTLMSNWFNEKRGLAIAIYATGSGFGGIVMNLFISRLIEGVGFRKAYLILALVMAVTIIPSVWLIVRDKPEDIGLEPYGGYPKTKNGVKARARGMSTRQALKTPVFYAMLPVVAIIAVSCNIIMQHSVAYFTDIGYEYIYAAKMASVITASLAGGKIIIGWLFDKIGARNTSTFSLVMFLTAFTLYNFAKTPLFMYIAVAVVGFGLSYSAVVRPYVTQEFFGRKDYATIFGYMTLASNLGSVIGNPALTSVYDRTGSYLPVWKLMMALIIICIILTNFAFSYSAKHPYTTE